MTPQDSKQLLIFVCVVLVSTALTVPALRSWLQNTPPADKALKAKRIGIAWWIWFILMPVPLPFMNPAAYLLNLVMWPMGLFSSDKLPWVLLSLSLFGCIINAFLLCFCIKKHRQGSLEGKVKPWIFWLGGLVMLLIAFFSIFAAVISTGD